MAEIYIPKKGERVEFASRFVKKSDRLLDIGCGDGILAYFIRNKVRALYGIDKSKRELEKARKNKFKTYLLDIDSQKFPFEDDFFDSITCLDVIEHVRDPLFLLNESYRVLKRNGSLILSTPNIRFSDHLYKLFAKGVFPKTSEDSVLYDGGHIHFFTFTDIKNLLNQCFFIITGEEGIINKPNRGWKGKVLENLLGKKFMLEFRSPGILMVAKK